MTKTNSEWKSDFLPFNHGEEGTHGCCNKHLKEFGGKVTCRECAGRTDCSNEETTEGLEKFKKNVVLTLKWECGACLSETLIN